MKAEDFDEGQGLTADTVREWLKTQGWVLGPAERDGDGYLPPGQFWMKDGVSIWDAALMPQLFKIANSEGRNVQALLRDLNPRLMPWPSAALIAAHNGPWLCFCLEDATACMGRFDGHWFKHSGNHVIEKRDHWAFFWPCDGRGNKVPLPAVPNV